MNRTKNLQNAIIAADEIVRRAWAGSSREMETAKGPVIGVRIPPIGSLIPELFVLTEIPHPNCVALFFAGAKPAQIYIVARHKCAIVKAGDALAYIIRETEADESISPAKSALRPIGCDIATMNTGMTEQRVFAAKMIAPLAWQTFLEKLDYGIVFKAD